MSANIDSARLRTLMISYRPWSTARPPNSTLLLTLARSGAVLERLELVWATSGPALDAQRVTLAGLRSIRLWGEADDVVNILLNIDTPRLAVADILVELTGSLEMGVFFTRQLAIRLSASSLGTYQDTR